MTELETVYSLQDVYDMNDVLDALVTAGAEGSGG